MSAALPLARVLDIHASSSGAAWVVTAQCPQGREVHHGGGSTAGAPVLGARASHCAGLPATRKHRACEHGDYALAAPSADPEEAR